MKPLSILVVVGTSAFAMAAAVATASANPAALPTPPSPQSLRPARSHDLLARFGGVDLATAYAGMTLGGGGVEAFCPDGRYFYRSSFERHGTFSVDGGRVCTTIRDAPGGRCRQLFRDAVGDLYVQALPEPNRPSPPLARFTAQGRELSRQCATTSLAGDPR